MRIKPLNLSLLLQRTPQLRNILAYGAIERVLPITPAFMNRVPLVGDLRYALLRVFLLKFQGEDYVQSTGISDPADYYYVKGRLLIVVDSNTYQLCQNHWVTCGGSRPRSGMNIKHQVFADTKSSTNIGGICFHRGASGDWEVVANSMTPYLYLPTDPIDSTKVHPAIEVGFDNPELRTVFPFDGLRDEHFASPEEIQAGVFSTPELPAPPSPQFMLFPGMPYEGGPQSSTPTTPVQPSQGMPSAPSAPSVTPQGSSISKPLPSLTIETPNGDTRTRYVDGDAPSMEELPQSLVMRPDSGVFSTSSESYKSVIALSDALADQCVDFSNFFPSVQTASHTLEQYNTILGSIFTGMSAEHREDFLSWTLRQLEDHEDKDFIASFKVEALTSDAFRALTVQLGYADAVRYYLSFILSPKKLLSEHDLLSLSVSPWLTVVHMRHPSYTLGYLSATLFPKLNERCGVQSDTDATVEHNARITMQVSEGYSLSTASSTFVTIDSLKPPKLPEFTALHKALRCVHLEPISPTLVELDDNPAFVVISPHFTLTTVFKAELEAFTYLTQASAEGTDVTKDILTRTLADFEESRGFSLSEEQSLGVSLTQKRAGVLSGCAGSGKTTTSDCMTMALENAGYTVLYAAPTGKAAKRLSEVVGRPVKTIHSFFRVPVGQSLPISPEYDLTLGELPDDALPGNCAIIFDEMAMCDSMLLSTAVVSAFTANPRVLMYFLGDVKQLPPIGKGMPYRDLMKMLPTVELGVSRRAAAGSLINYNCNVLNNCSPVVSDPPNAHAGEFYAFKEGDDFHVVSCYDKEILETILTSVQSALTSGYSPEDIQIVTPYVNSSPTRNWNSKSLNPLLQGVLNPSGEPLFTFYNVEYRLGDRLIHTQNMSDMPVLLWNDLTETYEIDPDDEGIVNGEVGTLWEFLDADDLRISSLKRDLFNRAPTPSSRVLILKTEDGRFYPYTGRVFNNQASSGLLPKFSSDTFSKVSLAYAMSVHKSQGSQYKVIIFPVGSKDNPSFVNRNMIYTAISRAQKEVYLIGSVAGFSSNLTSLRKVAELGADTVTVMSSLTDWAE